MKERHGVIETIVDGIDTGETLHLLIKTNAHVQPKINKQNNIYDREPKRLHGRSCHLPLVCNGCRQKHTVSFSTAGFHSALITCGITVIREHPVVLYSFQRTRMMGEKRNVS